MKKPTSLLRAIVAPVCFLLLAATAHAEKRVVAYVPNWIDLDAFSKTIAYPKLTHINIAFENPVDAEGNLSFNKQNEFLITRAHEAKVKVLLSIGGGSASGDKVLKARYFELLADGKRPAFVAKIVAYLEAHRLDGLDVDIEGPSINGDYGKFIDALAAALKPQGKLLTAALSEGYGGANVPDSALQQLDFLNIMAYDAVGYWDPNRPGQHSSLEAAGKAADYWLGRGVPASKAVLGVPFYGYGFGAAFRKNPYSYQEIVAKFPAAEALDQVGDTIWYNGIPTIEAKCRLVMERKLGGVMIWSLDNDGEGGKSLLSAIDRFLRKAA